MTEKVSQLQLVQQNLQNILLQKQQLESQLTELDSALTELENTDKAYKIVGKIMISSSKDVLKEELEQKKEVVNVRLRNFSTQEEKLKANLDELQKEVMEELKKDKNE